MKFIGVDPGKQGSISIIEGKDLCVIPTPVVNGEYDLAGMYGILVGRRENAFCVIERSSAMPLQGTVSMFTFGMGYGMWLALLAAAGIPYQIIHPRVWTKTMLSGAPGEGKDRSYSVARRMFPTWQPKFKYEYQYSDSILIAEYARRIHESKI